MAINIAGSLQATAVNLPLDARSRIATLDDVASIVNPALGGIFYCVATGRHYKITKLKAQTSGPFTIADKQVDTYEQLPSKSDVEAKAHARAIRAENGDPRRSRFESVSKKDGRGNNLCE